MISIFKAQAHTIKSLQHKPILLGIIFIGLSLLSYPVKAKQACVRTTSGQRVCGELLPKEEESNANKLQANGFVFELQGCQRSDDILRCNLLITNMGDSDRQLMITASPTVSSDSRVISASGEESIAEKVQFGQESSSDTVRMQMIRGVPIKAVLSFMVSSKVSSLAVLEVSYLFYNPDRVNKTIQFRNIAIQSR